MPENGLSGISRRSALRRLAAPGGMAVGGQVLTRAQAKTGKVRIGVVGGGFGAAFYWHLHPDCEVVAVCDIRQDRLKRLANTYRCGNTYDDFSRMLTHQGLNAVAVFTPAPIHVPMALEAMKAGKHVISAVPAGMSVEQLEELLAGVKQTGQKYMMAETSYYRSEIITCRELAEQGRFGTIFYSESEYHHEGLITLMFDAQNKPTWRHGMPPMLYPTHCTGMVVPVMQERLVEVQAIGWGDGHAVLKSNSYSNPFWSTVGLFKTSKGHSARVMVSWQIAAAGTERGAFYGDRMSYIMERPEGSPNTVARIGRAGRTVLDQNGYPEGEVIQESYAQSKHFERLPQAIRIPGGHGNSHPFLTHEFVRAIVEDRLPSVNVWEAIAYTLPGIVAHQSALRGGELLKIRDYGSAPGQAGN